MDRAPQCRKQDWRCKSGIFPNLGNFKCLVLGCKKIVKHCLFLLEFSSICTEIPKRPFPTTILWKLHRKHLFFMKTQGNPRFTPSVLREQSVRRRNLERRFGKSIPLRKSTFCSLFCELPIIFCQETIPKTIKLFCRISRLVFDQGAQWRHNQHRSWPPEHSHRRSP
jgi:hypothetical protein